MEGHMMNFSEPLITNEESVIHTNTKQSNNAKQLTKHTN